MNSDVVVVGGGPAGAAAAFVLANAGMQTVLVERRRKVGFKFGEMLPPHAHPLLRRFGLDKNELAESHAAVSGTVSVWGSAEPHTHDFVFNPYGAGLRLDRPRFDETLRERARSAGVLIRTGVKLTALSGTADERCLRFETGHGELTIETPLVVDCSGRRSVVARLLGHRRRAVDQLFAFARIYRSGGGSTTDPFLRIEAMAHGWLYSLMLPSTRRLVAFHTDADLPAASSAATPCGLDEVLAQSTHIGPLLAAEDFRSEGRLWSAPANGAQLDAVCGPGWAAAGDAALSFDPLSSQGMFSAIESGFAAADAIVGDDFDGYRQHIRQTAETYHDSYRYYYQQEQRWCEHPFWRRRTR